MSNLTNEAALKDAGNEHLLMHASAYKALAKDAGKRILVEGKGCIVKDIDGNEFIDALAGLWLVNVGHGRAEIGEAMARQSATLAYASSTQATTIPAIQLATHLAGITPGDLNTVFFCSGGSEAIESAIKIARQYHGHQFTHAISVFHVGHLRPLQYSCRAVKRCKPINSK